MSNSTDKSPSKEKVVQRVEVIDTKPIMRSIEFLFLMVNVLCDVNGEPNCTISKFRRTLPVAVFKQLYDIKIGTHFNDISPPLDTVKLQKLTSNSSRCGRPVVDATRTIVNGANAPEKAWPWHVILKIAYRNKTTDCGGSLISKSWVVTAAHCVNRADTIEVILGLRNRSNQHNDSNVQFRKSAKVIVHEHLGVGDRNDIALVKLNTDAVMTDYVSPVCLPKDGQDFEHENGCYLTGWGGTFSALQQTHVNIMPQSLCVYTWSVKVMSIDGRKMCVDLRNDRSGPCFGDSGGPLTCKIDGKFILAGVSGSTVFNCSYTNFPSVCIRVTEYLGWILTKLDI